MDDNLTKEHETYDPSFFNKLKRVEEEYFWFAIRRKWIFDMIKKFVPPRAKILEVGCGTGNVSSFLSKKGYTVAGCELYAEAIDMAWPGFLKVQGDSNSLPFKDSRFDIVGFFDVIEHFENDISPIKEAFRVVRKGGIIAVTVPARKELWSHIDEIAMHKRRYDKEMLRHLFAETKLAPLLSEYMFMSLYVPMKYMRGKNNKADLHLRTHGLVNPLLTGLFDIERFISKGLSLPIGTSIIAVAQKITDS
jgi:SAM-dependent methyltransferase